MNVEYIKTLSEGYVIDNNLYKEQIKSEELYEHFYGMIKNVRVNQPYLYKDLTEANKFEQQRIFKIYFDTIFKPENVFVESNLDLESLNEMTGFEIGIGFSIGQIVALFLAYKNRQPLTKNILNIIIAIFDMFNNIGKHLTNVGSDTRLAYSIIQSNSKKCYQECDFDPEEAGPTDYASQFKKGSLSRNIGRLFQFDERDEDKTDCLRECYFYSTKEVVKLSAQTYFSCLKNTGDLSKLPHERDFSAYQEVLTNSGLNNACDGLAKNLKDSFKAFNNVLELMYSDNPIEMKKQKTDLMMDIYNLQKTAIGHNTPNQNYQVKSFPQRPALPDKPKFQQNFNKPKQY